MTGTSDQPPGPVDLRSVLHGLGVPAEAIEQAASDGTLDLLALEAVVSFQGHRFDVVDVAERAGIEPDQLRAYWRALGFPDLRPGEKTFGDADVTLFTSLMGLISDGSVENELALQMARVVGSAMAKIANAQVESLEVRRRILPGDDLGVTPTQGAELLAIMPQVMEIVWRRQLAAAARRRIMRAAAADGGAEGVLVGFADLVGFTAKTQQLAEEELAEVVGRFEAAAFDIVARHGGRVIKMIGDEVMFLHEDVHAGAALALSLASRFRDDPALSDVRVGLAAGPVLERDGDVYGHVVNLANRIVSFAYPGSVVVSTEVHDALADDGDGEPSELVLRSLGSHELKNIGRVPLWVLRRADERSDVPYSREQARRASRQFLRNQWSELQQRTSQLEGELPAGLRPGLLSGPDVDPNSTGQLEALTEAVLDADLEHEMRVTLLGDLEVARRLRQLEVEAESQLAAADQEAERRHEEIEVETRARVDAIEREAQLRVEAVLDAAEQRLQEVRDDASRRVEQVAAEVGRKAERASEEAKADAQRKAERKRSRRGGR